MRIDPQHGEERKRLAELIDGMPVAMLTTLSADDQLVGRPMAPLSMDGDGALWFFTDLRSGKVEHLRLVNLAFTDAAKGVYVSVSGHGEIDVDRQRIAALWTPLARPWFPDGETSPDLALLKVVPQSAECWDAEHGTMVRFMALVASVVAGRPVGMGRHDTLDSLS